MLPCSQLDTRKAEPSNGNVLLQESTTDKGDAIKTSGGKDALIQKLLERHGQKDDQIASMLTKIDSLQTKLDALSDLMLKKQSEVASVAEGPDSAAGAGLLRSMWHSATTSTRTRKPRTMSISSEPLKTVLLPVASQRNMS